jgi:carboxypeptidase C (cathepsin A)
LGLRGFRLVVVSTLVVAGAMALPLVAQGPEVQQKGAGEAATKEEASIPIPPEATAVTKHDWSVSGQVIHYTATAGNLLIRDEQQKANASIFYVAYTQDGVDARTRPVTFSTMVGLARRRSGCIWDRSGRCVS